MLQDLSALTRMGVTCRGRQRVLKQVVTLRQLVPCISAAGLARRLGVGWLTP